jgi:hypothetical protein
MKKVYVVLKTELINAKDETTMFTDVIGVYTTKREVAKLQFEDTETVFYEIKEMPVNQIIQDDFIKGIEEIICSGTLGITIKNGKIKFREMK